MEEQLLAWIRDEVVTPIVTSLLTPDELDSIEVSLGPVQPDRRPGWWQLDRFDEPQVWVAIRAGDGTEGFTRNLLGESDLRDLDLVHGRAAQLASDLEDWVCETSFGWGQQRAAQLPVIRRA
ncbi:MAG TPA: hypothetical protein VJ872_16200 [Nocardioides sp.]|nr:hypothetical protein [Nocardioides sp.]